jgi:hypothetical protein
MSYRVLLRRKKEEKHSTHGKQERRDSLVTRKDRAAPRVLCIGHPVMVKNAELYTLTNQILSA